jgi:putative N6-adenine-specific DNA methylase
MVRIAEGNAAEAGFVDLINWEAKDLRDIEIQGINGVMVGNPPYGERIGELEEAEEITRILGDVMKNHPSWSVYMISPLENFESLYGRKATRKRKLFNGFIRTDYYQYWGKRQ